VAKLEPDFAGFWWCEGDLNEQRQRETKPGEVGWERLQMLLF